MPANHISKALMPNFNDIRFLQESLQLAHKGKGFCYPNPAVGSVIVNENQEIISVGFHQAAGKAHAEVNALKNLPNNYKTNSELTLYVTLEPCAHFGKTPPCVNAIIESKVISRVVYGYKDPNPNVLGKGADLLVNNNIECEYVSCKEIDIFYEPYKLWLKTQKPFITAKLAITLNGMIANHDSTPFKITGDIINKFTHQNRQSTDAILTTAETIISDNPKLNARIGDTHTKKKLYIIDRCLKLPEDANIFKTSSSLTVFYSKPISDSKKSLLCNKGCQLVEVSNSNKELDLKAIIAQIGKDGVHSLWVEAGGRLFASLLRQKLLQKAFIYIAPKWVNHGKIAFPNGFEVEKLPGKKAFRQYGEDVLCELTF